MLQNSMPVVCRRETFRWIPRVCIMIGYTLSRLLTYAHNHEPFTSQQRQEDSASEHQEEEAGEQTAATKIEDELALEAATEDGASDRWKPSFKIKTPKMPKAPKMPSFKTKRISKAFKMKHSLGLKKAFHFKLR